MKSYTVSKNPVFSASVPIIEESDPVNAEVTNAPTKKLIENDLALKAMVEKKMDPEEGMGLSHNDFTDEYKEAVDGMNGLGFGQDAEGSWGYKVPGANEVVPFGGSEAGGAGMYYCECTTEADVQVKTAQCDGYELRKGISVLVKFSQTNTALSLKLDIGGTGAKLVGYHGSGSYFDFPSSVLDFFKAGRTYLFTYDGSCYQCISLPGDETLYANRLIYGADFIKNVNAAMKDKPVGKCSVSYGGYASGDYAAAFGEGNASGKWSFASCQGTASGNGASALSRGKASGSYALAEGWGVADGDYSHAGGMDAHADADYSFADGWKTIASCDFSHAIGHYNAGMAGGASHVNTSGTAFCIGNGTGEDARSNALSVGYDGSVNAAGAVSGKAADYAEYFEWEDGNPGFDDRVGLFVTLEGEKIRIAEPEDGYILGIVSGAPFVLGNGDADTWNGMYLRDEFGRILYERTPMMETVEVQNMDGTVCLEEHPVLDAEGNHLYLGARPKINPDYDPSEPYVRRSDRPEWDAVGMLGVLAVRQDGTCRVNGYCTCGEGGKATACNDREGAYRIVKVVSDGIVKVVFR